MAVVAVTDNNTRHDAAETTGNWNKIGNSLSQEPDVFYQGSFAISSKIGTTLGGHYVATGANRDMTTAALAVVMMKGNWLNKNVLTSNPAALHRLGSGSAAYYLFYIADDGTQEAILGARPGDNVYKALGGFIITPINPNLTAWRDGVVGSPVLTAVDYFATTGDFSATSKSENVVTDAVDLSRGLYLVGGDSTDPDGLIQDFVDDDEGDTANRIGHVTTVEGVVYVFGKLVIGETAGGSDTATVFNDKLQTIVFPGGKVDAGWNGFEFELADGVTDIDFANFSFVGRGRDDLKHFFDSSADQVDAASDEIDIDAHGFFTGEAVLYSIEGGTVISGLADDTEYFVRAVTVDAFSLHDTRQDAYADTGVRNLVAASTGESHSIQRQPDTRPDFSARATGGALDFVSCVFIACRNFISNAAVEYAQCVFVGCKLVDLVGGKLTACSITDFLLAEGVPAVRCNDLMCIADTMFTRTDGNDQQGHAIEIDTAGTYGVNGNLFEGWGGVAEFNAADDVDGGTEIITTTDPDGGGSPLAHGFVDGEAVYYGDEGGTVLGGLTDGDRYYVNSLSATTLSLHVTRADAEADANRVNLTAGSNERHHLYSAHCEILNSSGGLVTVNVGMGGSTPTARNTPGSTTVINNTVDVDVLGVVANTQVAVFREDNDLELFNEEIPPTSRFWWERFEEPTGAGYDRSWSEGEVVSGGAVIDPNKATSGVVGSADRWQSLCYEISAAAAESAYTQQNFAGNESVVYVAVDAILDSESLANSTGATFLTLFDNVGNVLVRLRWYQDGSGDLRIRANIRFDDSDNFFDSNAILSLDTRYTVEVQWDTVANNWEWRIIDYSRDADGAYSPPETQDSGATLTSTREVRRIRIGGISGQIENSVVMTLDRVALDDTGWVYESATLEDVNFSFDFTLDTAIRIELRKSTFPPKYIDRSIPGTIINTGFSVAANQLLDNNAAV